MRHLVTYSGDIPDLRRFGGIQEKRGGKTALINFFLSFFRITRVNNIIFVFYLVV